MFLFSVFQRALLLFMAKTVSSTAAVIVQMMKIVIVFLGIARMVVSHSLQAADAKLVLYMFCDQDM